jgi:multimeric flavodoxin WrbA
MKKIVVIYGSPRRNGNSDKLGKAFVEGAREAGNIVNEFYARDLKINGCIGCECCYENGGECVQNDDMQKILKELYLTDILVFVTPIYYQSFTSQLKAIVDRLYVSENKPFAISEAVLLATYASHGEEMHLLTKQYYNALVDYHGWKNSGEMYVSDMDDKTDIDQHVALAQAYTLGQNA